MINTKIYSLLFYIAFLFSNIKSYCQTVTNDGLTLTLQAGLSLTVVGNYTNQINGTDGQIVNSGTVTVTGDWINNAASSALSAGSNGMVELNGSTASQIIGGTTVTEFYDLSLNNTFATTPQFVMASDFVVKNNIEMKTQASNWNVNMANYTFTLGVSPASPGTITHAGSALSGWFYGGNIIRYIGTGTFAIPTHSQGLFPTGSSAHFRPFWLGVTNALSTGGTVTLSHTPDYSHPINSSASHVDATWGGGTVVKEVSNSTWNVSTNGVAELSSPSFDIRYGGFGFQPFVLADVNASLLASTVATFAASTGVNVELEANRTGLSLADLNGGGTQNHRLGTRDASTSPLPIELLSFNAKVNAQKKVDLLWSTSTEINNDYFTIERTKDGVFFEEVVVVDGAGNSTVVLDYTSIDENPFVGISYYRLKQTDFDGRFTYSSLVPVNILPEGNISFIVNPTISKGDFINLLITSAKSNDAVVSVYDCKGKQVLVKEIVCFSGTNEYLLIFNNSLSGGMYLIKLESDGELYTQKLIVN